ncbi:MAG: ADP-ribosylglycohydrolase family protein, partial [Bacilli bacterium]
FLARNKYSKGQIKEYVVKQFGYDLNFNLLDLQQNYTFTSKCKNSVPQAIYCFLISDSFEDAIRKSLSIGGDSDTIACITGSISEAFYGINNQIVKDVYKFIPDYILLVINKFYNNLEKEPKYLLK